MTTIPIRPVQTIDEQLVASAVETFGHRRTLGDLLAWAGEQTPRVRVAEIIAQDEYTHDVVVPFGVVFLSFDTT